GKLVFDIDGGLRIMQEVLLGMLLEVEHLAPHTILLQPRQAVVEPLIEGALVVARPHEVLELHLLELAQAKDEVAGGDLVAEGFADLGDAKRQLQAHGLLDEAKVGEDRLARLRPQVGDGGFVLDGADERLEHGIEQPDLRPRLLAAGGAGLIQVDLIGPEATLAIEAFHHRVFEVLQMARGLPDARAAENAGVEADDVGARVDEVAPPCLLDVVPQLDAERAVVPHAVEAAVDLAAGEDEAAALAERHKLLHEGGGGSLLRHRNRHVALSRIFTEYTGGMSLSGGVRRSWAAVGARAVIMSCAPPPIGGVQEVDPAEQQP